MTRVGKSSLLFFLYIRHFYKRPLLSPHIFTKIEYYYVIEAFSFFDTAKLPKTANFTEPTYYMTAIDILHDCNRLLCNTVCVKV